MLDTNFIRETENTAVEDSPNYDLAAGSAAGMTFVGTTDVGVKVRVGSASSKVVRTAAPKKAHQRAEVEFSGEDTYAAAVLADSPQGYWRLGESSGIVLADSSGNGHDGSPQASPTLGAAGLIFNDSNKAANFDVGTLSRVSVPDHADFTNATVTVECWVKLGTFPTGATREWLVSKWVSPNQGWILEAVGTTGWRFFVQNGATAGSASTTFLNDNGTHHLVGRTDGTTVKIYVDGVERASGAFATTLADNAAPVEIGGWAGSSAFGAGATIDEVAVYNGALDPARITTHYNVGTFGSVATIARLGVFGRYADASNYVLLYADLAGTQQAKLVERVAGVDTVLLTLAAVSPGTAKGALRLELIGRRARVWYESQCSYVRDRPPDAGATLASGGSDAAPGGWGVYMEANAAGTAMRLTRLRLRDLGAMAPPAPHFTAADNSGTFDLSPLTLTAAGVSGSCRELEWEVAPADPQDWPEVLRPVTPAGTTSVVLMVGSGYAYDCRVREARTDGTFSDWTDWQRVTAAGVKPPATPAVMPVIPFPQTPFLNSYPMPRTHSGSVLSTQATGGRENRVAAWGRPRAAFTLTFEYRNPADTLRLVEFFNEMKAQEGSFHWIHPQTGESYAMRFASDDIRWENTGHAVSFTSTQPGESLSRMSMDIEEIESGVGTIASTQTLDPNLY
jgi:hypothetical protein